MPPPTPAECGGCEPAARAGVAGRIRPGLSRARDWCAKIGRPCEMQREGLMRADPGNPLAGARTIARECRTRANRQSALPLPNVQTRIAEKYWQNAHRRS